MHIECSDNIKDIGAALAKAQAAMRNAVKDTKNPHFKSTYADLASVSEACRPALNENGIAVIQAPYDDGDKIGVVTMLVHSSGQWMRGSLSVRPMKQDAQAAGSVITYLRRYMLAAMAGVAPEDDDGNAASMPDDKAPPHQQSKAAPQSEAAPKPKNAPDDKDLVIAACSAIRSCKSMQDLDQLWKMSAAAWRAEATRDGFDYIVAEKDKRKAELSEPVSDLDNDGIPY